MIRNHLVKYYGKIIIINLVNEHIFSFFIVSFSCRVFELSLRWHEQNQLYLKHPIYPICLTHKSTNISNSITFTFNILKQPNIKKIRTWSAREKLAVLMYLDKTKASKRGTAAKFAIEPKQIRDWEKK